MADETQNADPAPENADATPAENADVKPDETVEEKVKDFFSELEADAAKWFSEVARKLNLPLPSKD